MKRSMVIVGLAAVCLALAGADTAAAKVDPRFEVAESYLMYVNTGEFKKAYELLDFEISYDQFLERVEASNKSFAESLREHGVTLVSKKIERVDPMTFEAQYIIVSVRSHVVGTRGNETQEEDVYYQVYFRFNDKGKIDMVHAIGEGWIC